MNNDKQLVVIQYFQNLLDSYSQWKIKAEYSTSDNDSRVIVIQEQAGERQVFYGDVEPLYNYYMINIYGLTIRESKELSVLISNLIGENEIVEYNGEKWQIMFSQYSNPQAIEYLDIKRIGYSATMKCIVNKIKEMI
jgi:hypothetical protein